MRLRVQVPQVMTAQSLMSLPCQLLNKFLVATIPPQSWSFLDKLRFKRRRTHSNHLSSYGPLLLQALICWQHRPLVYLGQTWCFERMYLSRAGLIRSPCELQIKASFQEL